MVNQIEYADFSQGRNRLLVAGESQRRWYKKQYNELIKADLELRMKTAKEDDRDKRKELQKKLEESRIKIQNLNEAMNNSTLRKELERTSEDALGPDIAEQRLSPNYSPARVSPAPVGDGDTEQPLKLNGLGIVYGQRTSIGDYFSEVIEPYACTEAIRNSDVRCLFNHNTSYIYGRTKSGTLRLSECQTGVVFWCDLPQHDEASYALAKRIRRRDISGCSFAFVVSIDDWQLTPGKLDLRIIKSISELFDIGPVTYPAYLKTNVVVITEPRASSTISDYQYTHNDFLAEQDAEDDLLIELLHQEQLKRQYQINCDYRKAGRILNRNRALVDGVRG
jgi:hypothetical protein